MCQKRSSLSRLSAFLGGLATNVLASFITAGLLFVFAVVGVSVAPVRNALEDFFTTKIWLWVLVVALLAEAALFSSASWLAGRRKLKGSRSWVWEVSYGGVDWPVRPHWNAPKYDVDPPICPVDKTQLGLLVPGIPDEMPIPVAHVLVPFRSLRSEDLKFKCLKCSTAYDLSGLGYGMGGLQAIVEQLALAEERSRRT